LNRPAFTVLFNGALCAHKPNQKGEYLRMKLTKERLETIVREEVLNFLRMIKDDDEALDKREDRTGVHPWSRKAPREDSKSECNARGYYSLDKLLKTADAIARSSKGSLNKGK
jgi:hypothetical protein